MKKATTKETTPTTNADKVSKLVHELFHHADDEMDRLELKSFVDDENQPKMRELNRDDRVGVHEVMTIGAYMVLKKLHDDLHRNREEEVKAQLEEVFQGKVEFRTITPEGMPEELKDILENLVDVIKKNRK